MEDEMKPKYSVCVKPSARYVVCTGDKIWVYHKDSDTYVSISERGEWDTKEEALEHLLYPVFEIVAEVFE